MNRLENEAHVFKQNDIFTLNGGSLKLVDKFTYLGSNASSTENDINTWTAIDRLSVICKSNSSDKMKHILLCGCTNWKLTKAREKKLDGNCTRMLRDILNKSWNQHPKTQQLYCHLPHISNNIKIRLTRHAGHCWRSKYELISDILQWTSSHGRANVGRPARTYLLRTQVLTWKTCRKRWMTEMEGERESQGNLCKQLDMMMMMMMVKIMIILSCFIQWQMGKFSIKKRWSPWGLFIMYGTMTF